jgi:hypothetical protein
VILTLKLPYKEAFIINMAIEFGRILNYLKNFKGSDGKSKSK